jgi:hypothetical protein
MAFEAKFKSYHMLPCELGTMLTGVFVVVSYLYSLFMLHINFNSLILKKINISYELHKKTKIFKYINMQIENYA